MKYGPHFNSDNFKFYVVTLKNVYMLFIVPVRHPASFKILIPFETE